jgi:hypothetical protein
MATRTPPRSKLFTAVLLAFMASSVVLVAVPTELQAAETPRRGGVLLAVIGADPPSLDPAPGEHLRQHPARSLHSTAR